MSAALTEGVFQFLSWKIQRLHLEAERALAAEDVSARIDLRVPPAPLPDDAGNFQVRLEVRVVFPGDPPAARCEIGAVGHFRLRESTDEAALLALTKYQAPALVYTQLRPTVRILLAEAGIPGFLLPTVNFRNLLDRAEEGAEDGGDSR